MFRLRLAGGGGGGGGQVGSDHVLLLFRSDFRSVCTLLSVLSG